MEAMGIPPDTPSLLFTLLESYEREPHQIQLSRLASLK